MGLGFCQLGQRTAGVTLSFNFLTQSHINFTHFTVLLDPPCRLLGGLQEWEQRLLKQVLDSHPGGPLELQLDLIQGGTFAPDISVEAHI